MTWNFEIEQAPKGRFDTVEFERDGKRTERKVFSPTNVITASKCGKVIVTHWLEPEKRWNGYKKDENPIAWQDLPKHPEAA